MLPLLRSLHVLSVALWFGSVAFFTFAPLLILQAFQEVSDLPAQRRPLWLPLPDAYAREVAGAGLPEPTRREQGTRAFGVAVGNVFPLYYALQLACAVVALATAWGLARTGQGRWHGWRLSLCALALAAVLLGGWLERVVHDLREPRNDLTDAVLLAQAPSEEQIAQMRAARTDFGRWHGYSLVQNFVTLALVAAITVLAAQLPQERT
jgi:hypothetical protein